MKAGQPLFRIDPGALRRRQRSAAGQLARAEANAAQAKALAERYKPLVEANAISKQEYANAVAAQKTAEADVARGPRRACTTAKINLGYAAVTAPISGRIGRALVTEGALVGQGDATRAGRDPADRPDVRELHAVGDRGAEAAPRDGSGPVQARQRRRMPPACAWCWKTAPNTRSPAGCCSPT